MGSLTNIQGIAVGHATNMDALTGCTVILCEQGAIAGVAIPGSATGTEETELLRPGHVTDKIHGVCFAGGSAFGLEAVSGVRRFLEHKGVGFPTSGGPVPLVVGAILYDLGVAKRGVRPTREMGESAAAAASSAPVQEGAVGAGTGATVGKILGPKQMMKGGIGSSSIQVGDGVSVAALAAVNALGDVIDPETGRIVAGARVSPESREFANTAQTMLRLAKPAGFSKEHTTLVCVATDAAFDKVQMTKVAQLATIGMARTISPVFTMNDGDIVVALSTGARKASVDAVGIAASIVVSAAILRAVRLAPTVNGIPGLKAL